MRLAQRRSALRPLAVLLVVAALACVASGAVLFATPLLILVSLLFLDRYPGEQWLAARAPRRKRPASAIAPAAARRRPLLPRGGNLLACSLATRPPPPPAS